MDESDRIRFKRAKTLARNPPPRGVQYDREEYMEAVVGRQSAFFENKLVVPCCVKEVTEEGEVVYFTITYTPPTRAVNRGARNFGYIMTTYTFPDGTTVTNEEPINSETPSTTAATARGGASGISLKLILATLGTLSVAPGSGADRLSALAIDTRMTNADVTVGTTSNEVNAGALTVLGGTGKTRITAGGRTQTVTVANADLITTSDLTALKSLSATDSTLTFGAPTLTVESYTAAGTVTGDTTKLNVVPELPDGAVPVVAVSGEYVTISGESVLSGRSVTLTYNGAPALSTDWEIAYYNDRATPVTTSSTLVQTSTSTIETSFTPIANMAAYFAFLYRETANISNATAMSSSTGPVLFAKAPSYTKSGGPPPFTPISIDISAGELPSGYDAVFYYAGGLSNNFIETANPLQISIITPEGVKIAMRLRKISDPNVLSALSDFTLVTLP